MTWSQFQDVSLPWSSGACVVVASVLRMATPIAAAPPPASVDSAWWMGVVANVATIGTMGWMWFITHYRKLGKVRRQEQAEWDIANQASLSKQVLALQAELAACRELTLRSQVSHRAEVDRMTIQLDLAVRHLGEAVAELHDIRIAAIGRAAIHSDNDEVLPSTPT